MSPAPATRRSSFYEPETTDDGRATLYLWHVKMGEEQPSGIRATHVYIDQDANVFLLDRNHGDAIIFFAPRTVVTYVWRIAAVSAPSTDGS